MSPNHASAYLRQICCSGLNGDTAIVEFLKAVPILISSNSNTFSVCERGLDPTYHLAGFDLGDMAAKVSKIVSHHHTPTRLQRAIDWFSRHPILHDLKITDEGFYSTDLYNLIYRRFDMHHALWALVPLDNKRTGILGLYRPKNRKPFDNRDQTLLADLLPYVTHACQASNDDESETCGKGQTGLLVMDVQGRIVYQSPEGKRLLNMARYPRLIVDADRQDRLLPGLRGLCGNLQAVYRGRAGPPPSFTHTGANGEFRFRGHWLDPCGGEAGGLIGVTIDHRLPVTLKILRAMRNLPLSPAQKEVALLLAKGVSFEQIGRRLHIKPTTVKDHAGKIYTKLNIRQRDELLPSLLAAQPELED
jgi:DNA-binding CsgD family transcriptional regulator